MAALIVTATVPGVSPAAGFRTSHGLSLAAVKCSEFPVLDTVIPCAVEAPAWSATVKDSGATVSVAAVPTVKVTGITSGLLLALELIVMFALYVFGDICAKLIMLAVKSAGAAPEALLRDSHGADDVAVKFNDCALVASVRLCAGGVAVDPA